MCFCGSVAAPHVPRYYIHDGRGQPALLLLPGDVGRNGRVYGLQGFWVHATSLPSTYMAVREGCTGQAIVFFLFCDTGAYGRQCDSSITAIILVNPRQATQMWCSPTSRVGYTIFWYSGTPGVLWDWWLCDLGRLVCVSDANWAVLRLGRKIVTSM